MRFARFLSAFIMGNGFIQGFAPMAHSPAPPYVQAPDPHAEGSEALLQELPGPLWLPGWLPEGYRLLDLRLHPQHDARLGVQMAYTLVYGNGRQSLMLHSRLPGYRSETSQCKQAILHQRLAGSGSSGQAPRELLLIAPACSISGEPLSPDAPDLKTMTQIWQKLRFRKSPDA